MMNDMYTSTKTLIVSASIIALLAGTYILSPFTTIAQYERGVITRLGKVSRVAEPGLNFKIPLIESVHVYPTNIQPLNIKSVSTYTIDNQQLVATIIVNYRIQPDGVSKIYENVPDYEARLETMVVDRFKNALGKLNVVDVTQKRADIVASILANVKEEAARLYGLEIVDFQLNNIEYTKEFEAATEAAMTAKARVEQREQEKRQAFVEAERAKIEAEGKANAQIAAAAGEAQSKLAVARANAEAIRLEGLARAEALKAQGSVVTSELVDMKKAEQWNGQLPSQILGGTIPFMQIAK